MNDLDALLGSTVIQDSAITANPGASTTNAQSSQTSSNPDATTAGKPDAPAGGQATDTSGKDKPTDSAAPSGQAAPEISDEQLLNAAGLTETPEKKLSRLERDHAASSKEARRLLDYSKSLEEILKEQGLEIGKDEQGKPIGLLATRKYSKESASLDLKFKDLPKDVQAKAEDDPQVLVDFVLDQARKALVRAAPTLEKQITPVSSDRHEAAMKYLTEMKWETGEPKFPELAANRRLIEQQINAPNVSKALREFYYQEPELAVALLNLQFAHARAHILEQAKKAAEAKAKKKDEANNQPQPTASGGGSPSIVDGTGESDIGDIVAKARLKY